jgi:hypothetical protein
VAEKRTDDRNGEVRVLHSANFYAGITEKFWMARVLRKRSCMYVLCEKNDVVILNTYTAQCSAVSRVEPISPPDVLTTNSLSVLPT